MKNHLTSFTGWLWRVEQRVKADKCFTLTCSERRAARRYAKFPSFKQSLTRLFGAQALESPAAAKPSNKLPGNVRVVDFKAKSAPPPPRKAKEARRG